MSTDYHAQYWAHELTRRRASDESDKFSSTFYNATVDLNPHQIDAALFAFRNPLSRGAILADEVGLGKTIEAGLVISQLWAERKRRVLCIVPASIRKQWLQELQEKFFVKAAILESSSFNQAVRSGTANPFEQDDTVVVCSYNFARTREQELRMVPWDLVVVDEAHRLRNVYKWGNKIAKSIFDSISDRPKLLLTATPLQNSLMELFGLVSFIDPHLFGNEDAFREQYARYGADLGLEVFGELRSRLAPVCQRTLRRQVVEYVRYTNRTSLAQDFTPTEDEVRLYESVSTYLQRPQSFALPKGQRQLLTLVLRKILASSSYAIAATLGTMLERLESMESGLQDEAAPDVAQAVATDFEALSETEEEWAEAEDDAIVRDRQASDPEEQKRVLDALRAEIAELRTYKELAGSITVNAKAKALLFALDAGFRKAEQLNGPRKALVFTESRRTQVYLKDWLEKNGYAGQIVTFNGTNSEPDSKRIYREWRERHRNDDMVSGSSSADIRSALIEEFRERAAIMIATESGAEGVNLQFCNVVINYDLPWNPQRIEQRIGRCHRYGQKHDVVVINFLNRKNAADQRVYDLLHDKFKLFDGVFGASDEVLGALGSGADFEKRINDIYQCCRTVDEITKAFDQLQFDFDERIQTRLSDARAKLMEHFDQDVHKRLKLYQDEAGEQMDRFGEWLWLLTRHELGDAALFGEGHSFRLDRAPAGVRLEPEHLGQYRLVTERNGVPEHHYRVGHPLAEQLIERAKARALSPCEVVFHYDLHRAASPRISLVEALRGKTGWLRLGLLVVDSFEREEYLVFAASCDDGSSIDEETCRKLLSVEAETGAAAALPLDKSGALDGLAGESQGRLLARVVERNQKYFEQEIEKLDAWAEDLKENLERELKELDREIRATKKEARQMMDLDQKVALHKKAKETERKRNDKRRALFEQQDAVDKQKDTLITRVESQLKQKVGMKKLFEVKWRVV
jgi:superfamily II DNA or RNA helicase